MKGKLRKNPCFFGKSIVRCAKAKVYLQEAINVFLTPNEGADNILKAGVTCFIALYDTKTIINNLNKIC